MVISKKFPLIIFLGLVITHSASGQEIPMDTSIFLNLPDRSPNAATGSELVTILSGLDLDEREQVVVREILAGNVPTFARSLQPIRINNTIRKIDYNLYFFVAPDYLAIGSDQDYLYIPITPQSAQVLADTLDCFLPTKRMVDIIYAQAKIRLRPQPIPPTEQMVTVPVFWQHSDSIKMQQKLKGVKRSHGFIMAGHKKDIIISNKIYSSDRDFNRVVIYGWHRDENDPIQPVYDGHLASWVDYSHGVRLIYKSAYLNSKPVQLDSLLKDNVLSVLLSDDGIIDKPRYPK